MYNPHLPPTMPLTVTLTRNQKQPYSLTSGQTSAGGHWNGIGQSPDYVAERGSKASPWCEQNDWRSVDIRDLTGECRGCAEFQAQKEGVPRIWRWVQSTYNRWQHQRVSAQPAILSGLHRSMEHLYHVLHDCIVWIMINIWGYRTSTKMDAINVSLIRLCCSSGPF